MEQLNLFKVFMAPNVMENIKNVIESGTVTQGPVVEKYEQALSTYIGSKNIVSVNSATSGLTLAIRLLNLPPNSEILCTPLTCTATNWPVLANNFHIKWVDVDPHTCNMDLTDLKQKLTPNTRAVLFVHWGGYPINLDELEHVKEYYKNTFGNELHIIEDCAHALGAMYKYKKIGNSNNICVFSTQAIKHLTTIDGGFMTIPNDQLYNRAKKLRWFGIDRNQRTTPGGDFRLEPDVSEWGYKFHMNDVNAAVGLANLEYVEENLTKIKTIANYYNEQLKDVQGVELLETAYGGKPSYWIYTIKIVDKLNFVKYMKDNGVVCSQVHNRNDKHSCVNQYKTNLPQLDKLEQSIICIPCGWWMNLTDAQKIVSHIKEWCKKKTPKIRKLMCNDYYNNYLHVLTQLNKQSYFNYSYSEFESKVNLMTSLNHHIFIAELYNDDHSTKIVGTAKLIIEPKFYDPIGHVEDVVIDNDYQHMNIGKELVKYITAIAFNEFKCYKVVLNANSSLTQFYKKCGYEIDLYNTSFTFRFQKQKCIL